MKTTNKQQPSFAAILQFWTRRRWHHEISTNFNLDLYLKYLKAINEDSGIRIIQNNNFTKTN
jgi:hypothetical protein